MMFQNIMLILIFGDNISYQILIKLNLTYLKTKLSNFKTRLLIRVNVAVC